MVCLLWEWYNEVDGVMVEIFVCNWTHHCNFIKSINSNIIKRTLANTQTNNCILLPTLRVLQYQLEVDYADIIGMESYWILPQRQDLRKLFSTFLPHIKSARLPGYFINCRIRVFGDQRPYKAGVESTAITCGAIVFSPFKGLHDTIWMIRVGACV